MLEKNWRGNQKISMVEYIVVGRLCNFSFTNIKRLAMLLLGAIMVTMHIFGLGGTICCLHFWYFDMSLKMNGFEPKILRITKTIHAN